MAFVLGIRRLSQLNIDVSRDWLGFLIKNIGAAVDDDDAVRKAQVILQTALTTEGDILFRGASQAERLAPNAGKGYHFLKSQGNGLPPAWVDIQDIIVALTGQLNRFIDPPILIIPVSAIGVAVAEDHSGGGQETSPTLSIPAPDIDIAVAEDSSGGGQETPLTLNVPVPSVSVTAELV